ncbi:CRAL-TRIO domain-containing protein [Glomus cerebriforme]|uniref:CRAL-TRIO domain-containing protein n=1 Tax=Glomus cerebriforme TaxID=658196 RepID=A0A397TBE4_9GLOM|nr:CRAL-TRIO domain-containing protein [Glomus cerebriforme]
MSTSIALKQQQENPNSGHVGTLTKEQLVLLRTCYTDMFVIYGIIQSDRSQNGSFKSSTTQNKVKNGYKLAGNKHSNGLKSNNDKYNESTEFISAIEMYSPEDLRKAFWILTGADDPDILLLRFLRARKWDVEKAVVMLIATLKWRLQFDVEEIIKGGELGMEKHFAEKGIKGLKVQFTSGKSFVRGTDNEGRPVTYVNVKAHKKEEQPLEVLQKYTIYTMETVRLMVQPPVETGCLLFNMEGFSLANMDLQYVKFMIQCFEAYYPESLGTLLIHKAPWVFAQVWKIIAPLLDPVVASKIHFTKTEQDLKNFIPQERLIEDLGGKDKWKYKYIPPTVDENYKMNDEITKKELIETRTKFEHEFENIIKKWIEDPDNEKIINERKQLKVELRKAQLDLDPYIRSKTYYHRIGIIDDERNVKWNYID